MVLVRNIGTPEWLKFIGENAVELASLKSAFSESQAAPKEGRSDVRMNMVSIKLDGRHFRVKIEDGVIRAIKERKMYEPGRPWQALYDAPIWHHSHKRPRSASSIVNRVFAAVEAQTK